MSSTEAIVTAVLMRAPEWIRTDLAAKDAKLRTRAEEALAGMIADALAKGDTAARESD